MESMEDIRMLAVGIVILVCEPWLIRGSTYNKLVYAPTVCQIGYAQQLLPCGFIRSIGKGFG